MTERRRSTNWSSRSTHSSNSSGSLGRSTYHVYSHYGCSSNEIDRCQICQYLLRDTNTCLHPNPQSFLSATKPRMNDSRTPQIQPIRYRVDQWNDLYILPDIPATPRTRQRAENQAIINICQNDPTIDRVVVVDAKERKQKESDEDILYIQLFERERQMDK